jgi:deoxyribodipyrimidine photo-lyase
MSESMDSTSPIVLFWFRRDLRLNDNTGLYKALTSEYRVLPIFIFDSEITKNLSPDDRRISFIYQALANINRHLTKYNASIQFYIGKPIEILSQIVSQFFIKAVYANHDYEPYALIRDQSIKNILSSKGIPFNTLKDQVVFEKDEIIKTSGEPYTVFTPYSKRWLEKLKSTGDALYGWNSEDYINNFVQRNQTPEFRLADIGFIETKNVYEPFHLDESEIRSYDKTRNFPALDGTSRVGVHLRFGTVSIRRLISKALDLNADWLNELIWREFFMQILWHYPYVENQSFKPKYQFINWLNNEKDFEAWCKGLTGYPLVDAGMRELNATGFMHNRVRMVTASFLVKHLLINWQWGESYFASKLLDFELSSNNGNWQWAAGTGCDAAPYFRIFNPIAQAYKFDPDSLYIKKWVPEYTETSYPKPIIEHAYARLRCIETYKKSIYP